MKKACCWLSFVGLVEIVGCLFGWSAVVGRRWYSRYDPSLLLMVETKDFTQETDDDIESSNFRKRAACLFNY